MGKNQIPPCVKIENADAGRKNRVSKHQIHPGVEIEEADAERDGQNFFAIPNSQV